MDLKKAKIVIRSIEEVKQEWKNASQSQESLDQESNKIVFLRLEALSRVMTPPRLQILTVVFKEKPSSISALAECVQRDYQSVYADVKILAEAGLLEIQMQGLEDSVVPLAKYSGFEFDFAA